MPQVRTEEGRFLSPWQSRYGPGWRCVEITVLGIAGVAASTLAARLILALGGKEWVLFPAFFLGMLAADFLSGLAHWFADTWGTPDWPLLGKSLIRAFREHHVDPADITRHDFVETNGNSALVTVPVLSAALLVPLESAGGLFAAATVGVACLALLFTNQIHLWAHLDRPPRLVALLQQAGLLLRREHHERHHRAPFDRHYCITTGWLNGILGRVHFYRVLERAITATTGAIPREDALQVAGPVVPRTSGERGPRPEESSRRA